MKTPEEQRIKQVENSRKYYQSAHGAEYHRKYRAARKEKAKAYAVAYRNDPANAEKIRAALERDREKNRLKARDYYRDNHEKCRETARRSAAKNPGVGLRFKRGLRRKFNLLKMDRPCYDCGGVFPPEVMDWDHLPGTEKLFDIGHATSHSIAAVVDEIAKCQLACSNCHRLRTMSRKGTE